MIKTRTNYTMEILELLKIIISGTTEKLLNSNYLDSKIRETYESGQKQGRRNKTKNCCRKQLETVLEVFQCRTPTMVRGATA